jgi:hypothetical protein
MKLVLELIADQDSHYSRVTLVLIECNGSIRTECMHGMMKAAEAERLASAMLMQGIAVKRKKHDACWHTQESTWEPKERKVHDAN